MINKTQQNKDLNTKNYTFNARIIIYDSKNG